jgi:hypothetical protein
MVTMSTTSTRFRSEPAPCGRTTDGEHYQVEDEQGLVTDEWFFACGCERLRQEYHDGGCYRRIVRHDGKVLIDEITGEHGA